MFQFQHIPIVVVIDLNGILRELEQQSTTTTLREQPSQQGEERRLSRYEDAINSLHLFGQLSKHSKLVHASKHLNQSIKIRQKLLHYLNQESIELNPIDKFFTDHMPEDLVLQDNFMQMNQNAYTFTEPGIRFQQKYGNKEPLWFIATTKEDYTQAINEGFQSKLITPENPLSFILKELLEISNLFIVLDEPTFLIFQDNIHQGDEGNLPDEPPTAPHTSNLSSVDLDPNDPLSALYQESLFLVDFQDMNILQGSESWPSQN